MVEVWKGRGLKNNDKRDFKPLYIPWYETEFQADRIVKRMTSRQRAFYRNLLMDCYFGNERPYLPTDDDELWLIADADTKQEWLDNKALIMTKFTEISRNGELLLSNKRVMEEWQIIEDFLAQKKKAGLASAAGRRRQNGATTVQQPVNDRPTSVRQNRGIPGGRPRNRLRDIVCTVEIERVRQRWPAQSVLPGSGSIGNRQSRREGKQAPNDIVIEVRR